MKRQGNITLLIIRVPGLKWFHNSTSGTTNITGCATILSLGFLLDLSNFRFNTSVNNHTSATLFPQAVEEYLQTE